MTLRERRDLGTVVALVMLAALSATPSEAQTYDTSFGWGGGYVHYAPFVKKGDAAPRDIGFGDTWTSVLQAESWQFDRRVGFRFGGFYSHGSVTLPDASKRAASLGLEFAALLRFVPPSPESSVTAYAIGGGGPVWFHVHDGGQAIIPVPGSDVVYDPSDKRRLAALAGAGIEIRPKWNLLDEAVGLRIEGMDQIVFGAPFRPAGSDSRGAHHNLRVTLTLFSSGDSSF